VFGIFWIRLYTKYFRQCVDLCYRIFDNIFRRKQKLVTLKTLKCECGNKDQSKFITASDGEIVCGKCGAVIDQVELKNNDDREGEIECWNGELDLCRNLLEERVSKKGW
jgi:hypothetical protein